MDAAYSAAMLQARIFSESRKASFPICLYGRCKICHAEEKMNKERTIRYDEVV